MADEVVIAPVFQKKDSLDPTEMLQPSEVVSAIREKGKKGRVAKSHQEILDILKNETQKGDVIVFMSNGAFGGIHQKLLAALAARQASAAASQTPSKA